MKVINHHERLLDTDMETVGHLLEDLASRKDQMWPKALWPAMRFDKGLVVGSVGGHGPIGYTIETYIPRHSIRFQFIRPKGFLGWHGLDLQQVSKGRTRIRHQLEMNLAGTTRITWPLLLGPLHDALIEDAFTTTEIALGLTPTIETWTTYVRLARWIVSLGRASKQDFAAKTANMQINE